MKKIRLVAYYKQSRSRAENFDTIKFHLAKGNDYKKILCKIQNRYKDVYNTSGEDILLIRENIFSPNMCKACSKKAAKLLGMNRDNARS